MAERRALLVTTPSAAGPRTTGGGLRVRQVRALLEDLGLAVEQRVAGDLAGARPADLAVAVSYACAGEVARLRSLAPTVWLDAVDSWLQVDLSGVRAGRASYLARGARDALRLLRMPAPDVVTWVSSAEREADRGTVRAAARLVLPLDPPRPAPGPPGQRRVVVAGDWGYPPNLDGLRWLRREVLPRVDAPGPWTVEVFGGGRALSGDDRVVVRGHVDDDGALYRQGDVHVAPVRYGGGVKLKVLQPLLAGLPVVTTPSGARGLRAHPLLHVGAGAAEVAALLSARLRAAGEAPDPVDRGLLVDADDTAALRAVLSR